MTPLLFVVMCVGGGVGAALRLVVDGAVTARLGRRLPLGILVVNVTGSFVLGVVTGLAASAVLPDEIRIVVGAGVLGGYTTFSTASLDTVALMRERRAGAALGIGLGTLVLSVAAAAAGVAVGALA